MFKNNFEVEKTIKLVPGPVFDVQSSSFLNTSYFSSKFGNCGSSKSEIKVENQIQ